MRLTVVGLGLIGGSMAIDLRKSRFATGIIGVDNRPEHAAEAEKLGIVDRITDFESGVREADLVLLALPVDQIIKLLPSVLDLISPSTTVADVVLPSVRSLLPLQIIRFAETLSPRTRWPGPRTAVRALQSQSFSPES